MRLCREALPVRVSERVERVLTRGLDGGDVGDHTSARIPHKRILQDMGQLALSEGRVFAVLVNRPNALLQL